jgi:ATP phosphoribosyltransferase regulatory subunit
LAAGGQVIAMALDELQTIVSRLQERFPDLPLNIDLAELRGYHYHTGVVFAAFVPGQGKEIARGGRYDDIGRVFGYARPAVGFSADLKMLARLSESDVQGAGNDRIFAPAIEDLALDEAIKDLRGSGTIVIQSLGGAMETAESLGCNRELRKRDHQWQVV